MIFERPTFDTLDDFTTFWMNQWKRQLSPVFANPVYSIRFQKIIWLRLLEHFEGEKVYQKPYFPVSLEEKKRQDYLFWSSSVSRSLSNFTIDTRREGLGPYMLRLPRTDKGEAIRSLIIDNFGSKFAAEIEKLKQS